MRLGTKRKTFSSILDHQHVCRLGKEEEAPYVVVLYEGAWLVFTPDDLFLAHDSTHARSTAL
jgi:hypothetical protein